MTKTEITTAVERLDNAVENIEELCLNHKKNLFILAKKIFEYDTVRLWDTTNTRMVYQMFI